MPAYTICDIEHVGYGISHGFLCLRSFVEGNIQFANGKYRNSILYDSCAI